MCGAACAAGFVSALLKVFSAAGTLVGSLVAALMHTIYTDQELLDWAWRLPFALGIGVSVVGIWMRRGLREAAQFEEAKASGNLVNSAAGLGSGLWKIAPAIVRVIVVINLNNIGFCESTCGALCLACLLTLSRFAMPC